MALVATYRAVITCDQPSILSLLGATLSLLLLNRVGSRIAQLRGSEPFHCWDPQVKIEKYVLRNKVEKAEVRGDFPAQHRLGQPLRLFQAPRKDSDA